LVREPFRPKGTKHVVETGIEDRNNKFAIQLLSDASGFS